MKIITLLSLLLAVLTASSAVNAQETCPVPELPNQCFVSNAFVDDSMQGAFCHDDLSCEPYENIIKRLGSVVATHYETGPLGACVGDFVASNLTDYLVSEGCGNIPLVDGPKFRLLAADFPIDAALQAKLNGMGLWKESSTTEATAAFCAAIGTSCTELAIGLTMKAATVAVLDQIVPLDKPLVENIVTFLKAQANMGIDATFAMSSGGTMMLSVATYSPEHDFDDLPFIANFMIDFSGLLDLPFLDYEKSDAVKIEGKFSRSWTFEAETHAVLNQFSLHPLTMDAAFLVLFEYPEAVGISGPMSVGFSQLSLGLLEDLAFTVEANALKVPSDRLGWETGFYLSGKSASATELSAYLNNLCNKYNGAYRAVAEASCPAITVAADAKIGVFIQEGLAGFSIDASPVDVECRIVMMDSPAPAVNCRFGSILFQLVQDTSGYIVNKIGSVSTFVGDKVGTTPLRVSRATFDTFGGITINAANIARQVGDVAKKFGFQDNKSCDGNKEVLWSTGDAAYDRFFFQYGHGDTLGHCFNSCAENYLAKNSDKALLCCEYTTSTTDGNICKIGFGGSSEVTAEDGVSVKATTTFVADFTALSSQKEVGSDCEKNADCLSQFCFQKKCYSVCTTDDPCYPGQYAACGLDNNACVNVQGDNHMCRQGVCTKDPLVYNENIRFRLNHELFFVDLEEKYYSSKPAVFANLLSTEGGDTAELRVSGVTNDSFDVNVQEEASRDQEMKHIPEAIGFLSFAEGPIMSNGVAIGEVGRLEVEQDSPTKWFTMDNLAQTYATPLVFMMVNTFHGSDPCHMRIRNVGPTSFEYQLEEWEYLDGTHVLEEVVYLVIDEGSYVLDNGMALQAFRSTLDHSEKSIGFPQAHSEVPVVYAQTQTVEGPTAVITRIKKVSYDEFKVKLQEEEKEDRIHAMENIGVLVYGSLADAKEGTPHGLLPMQVDHNVKSVPLGTSHASKPAVFASIMSLLGGDTADVRIGGVTPTSFYVNVLEEQSRDSEMRHVAETIGYMSFPVGLIKAGGETIGEVGRVDVTQTDKSTWFTETLNGSYTNPIVFMVLNTYNELDPCHIRVKDVTATSFKYKVEEWEYLDGKHKAEVAVYLVVEQGVHTLDDGMTIQALKGEVDYKLKWFNYMLRHTQSPVVLSQIQTSRDATAANIRMKDATNDKVSLKLDEEENSDRQHGSESVGILAYGKTQTLGEGSLNGLIDTDHTQTAINLGDTGLATKAAVFTSLMTLNGGDPADSRVTMVTDTGFFVFVEEDRSNDDEMEHATETIGYVALGEGELKANGKTVAEVGRLSVAQPDGNTWFTVNLSNSYTFPLVIMNLNSQNDVTPAHIRVRNVGTQSFEYQIERWDHLADQSHPTEDVAYMVVEEGVHFLENGMLMQALSTFVDTSEQPIDFLLDHDGTPVVLGQVQTANDAAAVVVRMKSPTKAGITVQLQEEEGSDGTHAEETVAIVTYGAFLNSAESRSTDGYNSFVLRDAVGHSKRYIDLQQNFVDQIPGVIAGIMSSNGETADLRINSVTSTSFIAMVQEEQSYDSETTAGDETIGFLPFALGAIKVAVSEGDEQIIGEVGRVMYAQTTEDKWMKVENLLGSYRNPVVIATMNTFNGRHASHIRVKNVMADSFEFQIEEWDYLDGAHAEEAVVYLVMEEGTHLLPSGDTMQAFTVQLDHQSKEVKFPRNHTEVPVVFGQTQTANDATSVIVRMNSVGKVKFNAFLQEEEKQERQDGSSNGHSNEVVAFVTFGDIQTTQTFQASAGSGALDKHVYADVLDHQTLAVDFVNETFASIPAVFSSMQTLKGGDTATVRISTVTGSYFFARVQEELSRDTEDKHIPESFGFLAFDEGPLIADGKTIGLIGSVTVTQNDPNKWFKIGGFGSYITPVVIMMINSNNDFTPCYIRLRNVRANSFEYKLEEWDYLDGLHEPEKAVYMIVEEGSHVLESGMLLQAFRTRLTHEERTVKYPNAHSQVPVVLSQTQSVAEATAVTTRMTSVASTTAVMRLQEEEGSASPAHKLEVVGVVTFGFTGDDAEVWDEDGVPRNEHVLPYHADHQLKGVKLVHTYDKPPAIFAGLASANDYDPASIRISAVTSESYFVSIQEEQSKDEEITHGLETINYLAFDEGVIKARDITYDENGEIQIGEIVVGEVGTMYLHQDDANKWFTKSDFLKTSYKRPIVMMVVNTLNGWEPCHMRMRNIASTEFEYQLEEWDYLDGTHIPEKIAYMIIEEGVHTLVDGMVIQAFRIVEDDLADEHYYPTAFAEVPVVLAQPQTVKGEHAVTPRVKDVSSTKFSISLQDQQSNTATTLDQEVIGVVTYGRADIARAKASIAEAWRDHILDLHADHHTTLVHMAGEIFAEVPAVFAEMQSFNGADTADLRVSTVTREQFFVELKEEQSNDEEVMHTKETVGYVAFPDGPVNAGGKQVGEVGRVSFSQPDRTVWHTVQLTRQYVRPSVIMMVNTNNGWDAGHIRLRQVGSSSFEFQFEEWHHLDGAHTTEEAVYLVVEEGTHTLMNGYTLQAFRASADCGELEVVKLPREVSGLPVVLTQTISVVNSIPVTTRQKVTSNAQGVTTGFEMTLQVEEAKAQNCAREQVAVIVYGDATQFQPFQIRTASASGVSSHENLLQHVVGHHVLSVDIGGFTSDGTPAVFANMLSAQDWNPANLRISAVTKRNFYAYVQEETSKEGDITHAYESLGFMYFPDDVIRDNNGHIIGEVGRVTVDQPNRDTWYTLLDLQREYSNPVVIMNLNTHNGADPAHVRVRNVFKNSFEYQIEEWDYLDGAHIAETAVYLILESGRHTLSDEMGVVQVYKTQATDALVELKYPRACTEYPVVLSQTQTNWNSAAVNTRMTDIGLDKFSLRLQKEEFGSGTLLQEAVGVVVFGDVIEVQPLQVVVDERPLHLQVLDNAVDHNLLEIDLPEVLPVKPAVFAMDMSMNGGDTSTLRISAVSSNSFYVNVQEETSNDSEVLHALERIGYLYYGVGPLKNRDGTIVAEIGRVVVEQPGAATWFTMDGFQGTYVNPVVIMMLNTANDMAPAHMRVKDVSATSFSYKVEEWSYQNGIHGPEEAVYMIVEAGNHVLENNSTLQAMKTVTNRELRSSNFNGDFLKVPVVLGQTQTNNNGNGRPVVARLSLVTLEGFSTLIESEEKYTGTLQDETVGVVAYGS